MPWRLVNLGGVDGYTMVSLIKAFRPETPTLLLCYPEKPFVNVGYHQEIGREVDVEFCREKEIDIVRRPMGGGTILDGPWEQDFFVFKRSNLNIRKFFAKYLEPVVKTLQYLGIPATLRGNDITVNGKKIGGNGAFGDGGFRVLAGDILMDMNTELAVKVIKIPDEKFRDKTFRSMEEHLTTLKKEGLNISRNELMERLVENFEKLHGKFSVSDLSSDEWEKIERTREIFMTPEWIWRADRRIKRKKENMKKLKVAGGFYVIQRDFKFEKLIRITACISRDGVEDICISGDFFSSPHNLIENIEESIRGKNFEEIETAIRNAISGNDGKIIGFTPEDLISAIASIKEDVP